MSDPKDKLIEALRHAVEAKDGLIEALEAAVDAYKGLAEQRLGQVERLREEVAELQALLPKTFVPDGLYGWVTCSDGYTRRETDALAKGFRPEGSK